MRLRLKSKNGIKTISPDIEAPFSVLLAQIDEISELKSDVSATVVSIKRGFPPQPVDLDTSSDITIGQKGIKDGDQLVVEYGDVSGSTNHIPQEKSTTSTKHPLALATAKPKGGLPTEELFPGSELVLRNIPDDNSCLFNAISHAVNSEVHPRELRNVVAQHIQSNPDTFNAAILGREIDKYCQWILKMDSWGGAIELGILADWFNVRIECFDIESGHFIHFENEGHPPSKFIVLIYSGIHYDYLAETNSSGIDITNWTIGRDDIVLEASKRIGDKLKSRNYATNTTTFRVRCLECYEVLVGETGASKHAENTGHYKFGEVK